jgi:putative ABC transport system permease protein
VSWRSGGSWRVALKLARRDVWRAKGQSALVVAMIGIPIMLIAAGSVLLRSSTESATAEALRTMGPTDAVVSVDALPSSRPSMGGSE